MLPGWCRRWWHAADGATSRCSVWLILQRRDPVEGFDTAQVHEWRAPWRFRCSPRHSRSSPCLAIRYGCDPWMMALAGGVIVYAVLGRMEESRRCAREALELAGRAGHTYTLASAQVFVANARLVRRDARGALSLVDRALMFASERRFVVWSTWATLVRASALAELGQSREGLALAHGVLESWRVRGVRNGIPFCLSVIAKTRLALGQVQEALAAIDEALARSAATGEVSSEVWLHRLRGECLRRAGRGGGLLLRPRPLGCSCAGGGPARTVRDGEPVPLAAGQGPGGGGAADAGEGLCLVRAGR
jgi:hypothetical protein